MGFALGATHTEHLLMSLLAICIYSLEISKEPILMVIFTGTTNRQGPGQLKFFYSSYLLTE